MFETAVLAHGVGNKTNITDVLKGLKNKGFLNSFVILKIKIYLPEAEGGKWVV